MQRPAAFLSREELAEKMHAINLKTSAATITASIGSGLGVFHRLSHACSRPWGGGALLQRRTAGMISVCGLLPLQPPTPSRQMALSLATARWVQWQVIR